MSSMLFSFTASRGGAAAAPSIPSRAPCGQARPTTYTHVVWIMLENEGDAVLGSTSARYFNMLVNRCGLAANYYAISHPSLPNYVALTSGSTQGIVDDGDPSSHRLTVPSLFSQLGSRWRTLAQSMPSACDHVTTNLYAARHNPAVYFTAIDASCQRDDVPLTYPLNLSAAFTMIVPNICDDMHSCPVADGDAWLRRVVPLIVEAGIRIALARTVHHVRRERSDGVEPGTDPGHRAVNTPGRSCRDEVHALLAPSNDRGAVAPQAPRGRETRDLDGDALPPLRSRGDDQSRGRRGVTKPTLVSHEYR